tara:strand:+ start:823 stop:1494 length:672 start_codon:yes stop_codon:yes gene_type:complete
MSKCIVIVAAHPDDEILGCGGSVAKWVSEGYKVYPIILASGGTNRKEREQYTKNLKICALNASKIIGTAEPIMLNFNDNRLDGYDLLDLINPIEKIIQEHKPEKVLTHHWGDVNIDHQLCNEVVVTATRPQYQSHVNEVLSFETPSSTEWQVQSSKSFFQPNYFVDITDFIDIKIRALKMYSAEMRDFPHPRSIQGITYLANWRGACNGFHAAEAFQILRKLG